MMTIVNAADTTNYSVGMSLTSNSKLKAGDTVTVSINLTSINAGDGIDTITAKLNYDKNVLEQITVSNFSANNAWTPSYAETTNMMTFQKNSKVKSAETVATISFKVKDTISVDSTTIKLEEIVASGGRVIDNGTGDITVKNATVTISKAKEAQSNTENNTTTKTNTVKDNTVTNTTKLPKTGMEQYGVIAIVVVAIIGIFSYVLYKKIAKDVK